MSGPRLAVSHCQLSLPDAWQAVQRDQGRACWRISKCLSYRRKITFSPLEVSAEVNGDRLVIAGACSCCSVFQKRESSSTIRGIRRGASSDSVTPSSQSQNCGVIFVAELGELFSGFCSPMFCTVNIVRTRSANAPSAQRSLEQRTCWVLGYEPRKLQQAEREFSENLHQEVCERDIVVAWPVERWQR